MITRVVIKGYKSLRDVDLELSALTLVIGPNASGKSNLLDALGLLSRMATGGTIRSAFDEHRGNPLEAFFVPPGGLEELLTSDVLTFSLGVEVESVKRAILGTAAMLTGAAVAVSGVIGFVGLVVPHVIRMLLGPAHRTLLPASILTGALFLIVCDILARTIHPPTELRLGVVTAMFGAPLFLYLLRRKRLEIAIQ